MKKRTINQILEEILEQLKIQNSKLVVTQQSIYPYQGGQWGNGGTVSPNPNIHDRSISSEPCTSNSCTNLLRRNK